MNGCGCTEAEVVAGCRVHDVRTWAPAGPLSPDCRDGNHAKCDGAAWDLLADAPAACRCRCDHNRHAWSNGAWS